MLLPGASAAQTAARAADGGRLSVLANTNEQQGIHVPSLGFTGVNFWLPATVGDIGAGAPASVMIRESGGTVTLGVSGPPRDGAPIDLTWQRAVSAVTSHDPAVRVLGTGVRLSLRVTPGTLGAVHKATVTLG
ncbi:polysaccharide lyase beta-sandwich domain-containing protein [Streptomyces sp. NPDC052023]|uniref:polysaccharide lyase beta-sandwich domain-containing protein n=1 Tax=Streptomyces sp. NPDC052023 TaxID=3365681 RepID=UPI0037D81B07